MTDDTRQRADPETEKRIWFLKQTVLDERRKAEALKQECRSKAAAQQGQLVAARRQLAAVRASVSFQLGHALVSAVSSWRGLVRLPMTLGRIGARGLRSGLSHAGLAGHRPKLEPGRARPPQPAGGTSGAGGPAGGNTPRPPRLEVPRMDLGARSLQSLRLACIVDDFTFAAFAPECSLAQLTPENWRQELEDSQPDMLFVESAWQGKDGLWKGKVAERSREILDIVKWSRDRGIPTAFWNKEDPLHFGFFLNLAAQFDHVFTTDMDCIARYKALLGHERVYLLPFACQPAVHNPVEVHQRRDAICFAGSYYSDKGDRIRALESFTIELSGFRPLVIYDRNHGSDNASFRFPDKYRPYILGSLPFAEIDKAYKGYRYAINLNLIKQSQTMFARRVYELLASNTLTVSNYSRGLRLMLGDLVITTDDGAEAACRLQDLAGGKGDGDRVRLAALRKVMLEHTYGERLAYVASKLGGQSVCNELPVFRVVARADSEEHIAKLRAHLRRQNGVRVGMTVVSRESEWRSGDSGNGGLSNDPVDNVPAEELAGLSLGDLAGDADWIAAMWPEDYYGPHYLLDLALATRYSQAPVIGKAAFHALAEDGVHLHSPEQAYRHAESLRARRAAIRRRAAGAISAGDWIQSLEDWQYQAGEQLAIDPYNYCQDGAAEQQAARISRLVDDIHINSGVELQGLLSRAEAIAPLAPAPLHGPGLDARQLAGCFGRPDSETLKTRLDDSGWRIMSSLPAGGHEYLFANTFLDRETILADHPHAGELPCHLEAGPGLNMLLVISFVNAEGEIFEDIAKLPNKNHTIEMPVECEYIRPGLRIVGGGSAHIRRLLFGRHELTAEE